MKVLIALLAALCSVPALAGNLSAQFDAPPASARPWVYWFWNNANVTKAGITADLQAMKRAGLGGVLIMDVVERFAPPRGTAQFMNLEWRELFRFAVSEAGRLGLEVNLNNGPGWSGSSGPWITPELSMQMLVRTNLAVAGPAHFSAVLPRPALPERQRDSWDSSVPSAGFYRDIAVLAFPQSPRGAVPPKAVLDLTAKLQADGRLNWLVPPGHWILERIGRATTGASTRPPVAGGIGLECDKLSRAAMDAHFAGMMDKLIREVGPLDRQALVAAHIDSWEAGNQNWTPNFRREFLKRRGYDPIPFLPDIPELSPAQVIGREAVNYDMFAGAAPVIGERAVASRFGWDFARTISELLAENYSGRLAQLAHHRGLRLSMEGYDLPFGDEAECTARADEPMSEFWTHSSNNLTRLKAREMASVGHIYGRPVIGAESFTSGGDEKWKDHPATIKSLGDFEFCQGINRLVIHRFAHQPYLDRAPGATMGEWGLHYERTQTWWEMSGAWHQYLARCQFMLRQGKFVADLCCLRPESPVQRHDSSWPWAQNYFTPAPAIPPGYKYDECSPSALMARISVQNGRLVLPDGMSYRLLVVPPASAMTPALARTLRRLVAAGATVLVNGPAPQASPSLSDYPKCDQQTAKLTGEIWGDCDGQTVTGHALGRGRLIWGQPIADVLAHFGAPPDFTADVELNWIHRLAKEAEIYFVANPSATGVEAHCHFRVKRLRPELWNPETGQMAPLAVCQMEADGVSLPLHLEQSGSTFVVFRSPEAGFDPVVNFTRDGAPVLAAAPSDAEPAAEALCDAAGRLSLEARQAGHYELTTAGGTTLRADLAGVPAPLPIGGAWELRFPPKWGAPEKITMESLGSWTDSTNDGVKFFSGTATYGKTFEWDEPAPSPNQRTETWLNLGDVQVMAQVILNGRDLGVLWKRPFRVDVTRALRPGPNALEIRVANLWPNRMIGDAALPEKDRFTWSSWEPFKANSPLLKSGLLGPVTIQTALIVSLP